MQEPLVLTFDLGTQSTRALLVNQRGQIVHKTQLHYEVPYRSPEPGWAEQEASCYWNAICQTSLALKEKAGESWAQIAAVTTTTIRDSCLCLDAQAKPLTPVILWLDKRETTRMSPLPSLPKAMFQVAGMREAIHLQRRISACNWIMKHQPEVWANTNQFVFISAWITSMLCGQVVDSTANIIGHIPFDVKRRTWMKSSDFRRVIFNIAPAKLCRLVEPGETFGTITPEASRQTGIPQGLPLIATGSDKGCETLGLSCLTNDKAALSFGTTATVQLTSKEYLEPLPFIPPYPAVISGYYNPEVEIYRGYWLVSWFKREFAAKEVVEAREQGIAPEVLLNQRLSEIPPGCEGLLFQPYFTPGIAMPHARGSIIGFSDVHTRIHIYRAIIEGINFGLMEGLFAMEKRGKLKVRELYAAGGGSQSDEICQITATMFGLPLNRIQTHEVSAIGSSMVAFVALGIFAGYPEAIKAMVHIKDTFHPNLEEHQIYKQLYLHVFTRIFDKLLPLYQEVKKIHRGERKDDTHVQTL